MSLTTVRNMQIMLRQFVWIVLGPDTPVTVSMSNEPRPRGTGTSNHPGCRSRPSVRYFQSALEHEALGTDICIGHYPAAM